MTSMRESPIKRRPPSRPSWLIPLLVVVALLVVVGVGYGAVTLLRGTSDDSGSEAAGPTPEACATATVTPAEVLPKPAKVRVNVYNATSTSGLASKTADQLEKRGFRIGKVANDPAGKPIPGVAELRYGPKGAEEAQLMLIYVPGATLVELDRKGQRVDLAMGDAFTGIAPEQQVNEALSVPSPVASGLGCPSITSPAAS